MISTSQMVHGIENTVDKRCNTIDKRNLSTLFQMTAFQLFQIQPTGSQFVGFLLQYFIQLMVILAFPVQVIEQPQ